MDNKGSLHFADTYKLKDNIRYQLSSKLMNELYMKWMSQPNNLKVIKNLVEDCKKSKNIISTPSPLFLSRHNSLAQSTSGNTFMPPMSPSSSSQNTFFSQKSQINFLSELKKEEKISKDSKTFFKHISAINYEMLEKVKNNKLESFKKVEEPIVPIKINIPQFYFGDLRVNNEQLEKDDKLISKIFDTNEEITNEEEFKTITDELLGLPKMFSGLLFRKIDNEQNGRISKAQFLKVFKENFQGKSQQRRLFNFIKLGSQNDYLVRSDFMPFMRTLLELHPGLEFLKSHAEFQDKYSDTVIMRIFYSCDLNYDEKITFREFKKSDLMTIFFKVCEEPDINKVREYFSYEHFYVLYCKFWELDTAEHDFLIDKEDFIKYDGHSLSRKAVDRIFQQIPRRFKSGSKENMNFEDFVWFMLSEEDKTTRTSIEYWFKVVDLDNNGIITPYEMNYFYEEQLHRLEYLGNECVNFNDMVCQLSDMLKPEMDYQFKIENFLNNKHYSSVFFNSLLNLNKFQAFEQRDPFSKSEIEKNQDYSDWDKFAYNEYLKLTHDESQEEEVENDETFDSNSGNVVKDTNVIVGDNLDISGESRDNDDD